MNSTRPLEVEINYENVVRIPCLSHVIQLAQGALLDGLKCKPTNEEVEQSWDGEAMERALTEYNLRQKVKNGTKKDLTSSGEIPLTLFKVCLVLRLCTSQNVLVALTLP
jgi:hypothetical protein